MYGKTHFHSFKNMCVRRCKPTFEGPVSEIVPITKPIFTQQFYEHCEFLKSS